MNTNKKTAICPQCGAQGEAGKSCEFCGSMIPMLSVKDSEGVVKDNSTMDYIIKSTSHSDQIRNMVLERLVKTDTVPLDVFEKIEKIDITKCYVPAYNFVGSFQAAWNCTQIIQVRKTGVVRDAEGRPIKNESYFEDEYHPINGHAYGRFDFLSIASKGLLTYPILENHHNLLHFDQSLLDEEAEVLPFEESEEENWNNDAEGHVENLAREASKEQAPHLCRDFSSSESWNKDSVGTKVLVPIWKVCFKYNGQDYLSRLRADFPEEGIIKVPWDNMPNPKIKEIEDKIQTEDTLHGCLPFIIYFVLLVFALDYKDVRIFVIICSLLGIFITVKYNSHKDDYVQELKKCIDTIKNGRLNIRRNNAKRFFDYGDYETPNVDISNIQEPKDPTGWFKTSAIILILVEIALLIISEKPLPFNILE